MEVSYWSMTDDIGGWLVMWVVVVDVEANECALQMVVVGLWCGGKELTKCLACERWDGGCFVMVFV